jgi:cell division septation protein DedD
MLHIVTQERFSPANFAPEKPSPRASDLAPENIAMDAPSIEDMRRNDAVGHADEYEFVVGPRQVASLSLVVLVLVSLFAGISYLAGRAAAKKDAAPKDAGQATIVSASPQPPAVSDQPVVLAASLVESPAPGSAGYSGAGSPQLFSEPIKGAVYIQTGAVERGVAAIMAEGLRVHGFTAFVAAGPNDKIYRVLMGPFSNPAAYQSAKATLDAIGLSSFAQQYQK